MPAKAEAATSELELHEALETLLGKYDSLAVRMRHLDFSLYDVHPRISVRGTYLSLRDGLPTTEDFVSAVHSRITSFCLPRNELREAHDAMKLLSPGEAAEAWTKLVTKASQQFIKAKKGSHRSGEASEIILYILLEWLLRAPQIISKIYLKTNNQMPVHGTDGVHAKYDLESKSLFLYWGESKAYKNFNSAFSNALDSIIEFIELGKEEKEIDLVHAHIDLGDISSAAKDAILEFLDPYSENSNERRSIFACLLVFDDTQFSKPIGDEEKFVDVFRQNAEKFVATLKPKLEGKKLFPRRFDFFLLPVASVQTLRDLFQQKIGWPK